MTQPNNFYLQIAKIDSNSTVSCQFFSIHNSFWSDYIALHLIMAERQELKVKNQD